MRKYAKIANPKTNLVSIGLGDDVEFYKSIGFELMAVEQGYDGCWYLEGKAPAKPGTVIKAERITELEAYLSSTDWYAVRFAETGREIPEAIRQKREAARLEISTLRGE